jgi:hypothetical protein
MIRAQAKYLLFDGMRLAIGAAFGVSCGDVTSDLIVRRTEALTCRADADCPSEQPRCELTSGRCRECLERSDCGESRACSLPAGVCSLSCDVTSCPSAAPMCDLASGLCRGCESDTECVTPASRCNLETGACVECFTHEDCQGERRYCDDSAGGRCVECLLDAHCEEGDERCSSILGECAVPCSETTPCVTDDPICDLTIGYCVECMQDANCDVDEVCRRSECENSQ